MRALGLDLGTRRIGVAISDSDGKVATAIDTLERRAHHTADHERISQIVAEWGVEIVVVGLPLSLDGRVGPAASAVLDEIDELARVLQVPVETVDERFTTVTADQQLRASGVRGAGRSKIIDQAAARVLLQTWLDGR